MKRFFFLLLCSHLLCAQDAAQWETDAARHYQNKSYVEAGEHYKKAADHAWMKALRKNALYNAACSFALAGQTDRAFETLALLVRDGYTNRSQLENDADFTALHQDARWNKTLVALRKKVADSPHQSKFITADIDLFYRAFDLAMKDSANAATIFKNGYFAKGSEGLQDFFISKIGSTEKFAQTVFKHKSFYANARKTVTQTVALKGPVRKHAARFEELYPQAVFPDVYFVIGRLNSNGTISDNGLLIGIEQMSRTPNTDISGWNDWQREWIMNFNQVPVTVTHELVHFNQSGMKRENTLLCYALFEGGAEFIAELVTGQTDGDYSAFKGHEKRIWKDFEADCHNDVFIEWIEAQPDKRPRNALYWAGYMISKAYYENAGDKQKAIADILNIQNYDDFYAKSKAGEFIKALN